MERNLRNLVAGLVLCAAAAVMAPESARAYDVTGVGLGADVLLVAPVDLGALGGGAGSTAFSGPSGLALSVGLGGLQLDFLLGTSLQLPEGGVLEPDLMAAAGAFFVLAGSETTNLELGGRLGVVVDGTSGTGFAAELDVNAGIHVELDARVTHRLDDHCVLNFQVGMMTQIWPDDPDVGTGRNDFSMAFGASGLVGGAGFRYYFDGLGGGAPGAAAPTAQPASTTTTTTPAETQESGSSTPYWEQ